MSLTLRSFLLLLAMASVARAEDLTAVNLPADAAPSLQDAARAAGLSWVNTTRTAKSFAGTLVVWEAQNGGATEITPENAAALASYVQGGGNLLLTLSRDPGLGPFRLSSILPTTAWQTMGQGVNAAKNSGPVTLTEADANFFPGTAPALTVPFRFSIRPFHAVERGEGRYESFVRPIPYLDLNVLAGNTFWTRSLLNRDWQIRARGNDIAQSPILLTGQYGAGRVAVFASSAKELPKSADAEAFWGAVLSWLKQKPASAPIAESPPVSFQTKILDATRELQLTITNPTPNPLPVQLVTRWSTWERALVGDVSRNLTLPANSQQVVKIAIPPVTPTKYQALDFRDAFRTRIGILSGDGSKILAETSIVVDPRPALQVQVSTSNLRTVPYPFNAPGPEMINFPNRMGTPLSGYAYPPGKTFNANVTLTNGVTNLAPLAVVSDEVKPDNLTTPALNDEAQHSEQGPNTDRILAYGSWTGLANQENILSFTFPSAVTLSNVTLMGCADNFRNQLVHNPDAAVVEIDGKEITRAEGLDAKFIDGFGQVRLEFAPKTGRVVRIRLPWIAQPIKTSTGDRRREAPWLGEVLLNGTNGALPALAQGNLNLVLRDSFTGKATPIATKAVTVQPGTTEQLSFPVTIPDTGAASRFYSLEASFSGQTSETGFMAISPQQPLTSLKELKPPTAPDLGFIVTRGFRNVFETGTGTAEFPPASWGTPDDLIWAYSHQMKQIGAVAKTQANRLYLSESDMRHYSTPWRDFPNGEYFYDVAPDLLVQRLKTDRRWNTSDVVILSHSDRWDCAPDVDALHGWQDFIAFDDYLKAQGGTGLTGKTRQELATEIHAKYESNWQAFHLERYNRAVSNLRNAFAKEGKRLVITAQGSPLVPAKYETALTSVIRGQSDDSTWAMQEENSTLTIGRQMGIMAFNPGWAMSTLIQWGWDSAILNNPHWHQPVGTTEPSRRHIYDRAWRGTIGWDGRYKSMHTYGYNTNGGVSFTMTPNDWQQWWNVEERHSLISPDAPLGAGLIISTARFGAPGTISWSGSGGSGKSQADDLIRAVQRTLRAFQDAGFSIPFAANAGTLRNWKADTPLVLLDLSSFSTEEISALAQLKTRGVPLLAFKGPNDLSREAAALFGVKIDGTAAQSRQVADLNGQPVVVGTNTLLVAAKTDDLTVDGVRALASTFQQTLKTPLVFPAGTSGYGFVSQGRKFIVVEDWREEGRTLQLRLRAAINSRAARAVDANSSETLKVRRDGADWVIDFPTRPGDGTLIAVDEEVAP